MKFGINFINSGPGTTADTAARWAGTVEALGYDLLMVSDHVAITPDVAERYPAPFFDTPATLGWLAANTTRIELGTTVMLLPLRHVLDTARIVGTVDQLAGGRLTAFGIGLGWAQGEFEALGVPFERRAAITDDYLAALRELWNSDLASYDGAYARFSRVQTAPRPSSTTAIWVGGVADAALRRAVRYGDAWHPISFTLDSLAERLARLRAIADGEQRPVPLLAPRIRLVVTERPLGADRAPGEGTVDQIRSDLAALETLGAACVILDPFVPRADGHAARLAEIERMAAKIIELR
ncbi:MAG TPA: TIGR03619 family F420-dependent LLM class oxidoreductase [Gaiellaceae bacterium]|nr:TIGR03619 family F420-dependent LLM class oxidoreductase [Gaiellaceae bacterium]